MGFLRYANARVVHSYHLPDGGWDNVRVASGKVRADRDLVDQASKILNAEFSPSKYLLTHATIVASVDTMPVPGVKLGSAVVDGKKVVRKTAAFRIKPECDPYINNNLDSWSRPVLLKSYPTFIGGHSFLEHVQVEELSKGRILDAVARDLGDSVYVDILIANDRKHTELIRDIESGKLATLSMGCSIDGSTCTKCGHWAADETEMCEHVRFAKGNTFYDERGQKHRIAELCGDESLDPTGGVTFIEASWVEVPAFKGAVARNIVTVSSDREASVTRKLSTVFTSPVPRVDAGLIQKAAFLKTSTEDGSFDDSTLEDFGGTPDETPNDGPSPEPAKEEKNPFADVEDDVAKALIDRVKRRVKDQLSRSDSKGDAEPSSDPNDTIIKQGQVDPGRIRDYVSRVANQRAKLASAKIYKAALRGIVTTSATDIDMVERIATLNQELGIFIPQIVYQTGLRVGPLEKYGSLDEFLSVASKTLGRVPTTVETKTLIRLGSLLSAHKNRRTAE